MSADARQVLGKLLARYRRGSRIALLFDYDGTLVPYAEQPSLARLERSTRRLLRRLARLPRVNLGILSGRTIDDVKRMVRLRETCYAGACGLELDLHDTRLAAPGAHLARGLMVYLHHQLKRNLDPYPGAWLENKGLAVTVHYRSVPEDLAEALRRTVHVVVGTFNGRLRPVAGRRAVEIIPALGWSKGTAAQLMMRHFGVDGEGALYAGDDANDEEALEMVNALGGTTIGVGPHCPSIARFRVPDHAALIRLLCTLGDALAVENERDDRTCAVTGGCPGYSPLWRRLSEGF